MSEKLKWYLFLLVGLTTQQAWSLPDTVKVQSEGKTTNRSARWGVYKFSNSDFDWHQFQARIVLGKINNRNKKYLSASPYCQIEDGKFVAFTSKNRRECEFKTLDENDRKKFILSMKFKTFTVRESSYCKEIDIKTVIMPKGKVRNKKGFFSTHCEKSKNGIIITVDYPSKVQLTGSSRLEKLGKNNNFKVYEFIGFGKLSNTSDLELNSFQLKSRNKSYRSQNIKIQRKSFLLLRQSPFEVDVGATFNQINLSSEDGSASTLTLRGNLAIAYFVWRGFFVKTEGAADIFGSDDLSGSSSSYFFYKTLLLAGYRFNFSPRQRVELIPGLNFSKYSYQLGLTRRVFTRKGFMGKLKYSYLTKGRVDISGELQYALFDAGNSVIEGRIGYRLWNTKFTLLAGGSLTNLIDDQSSTQRSDTVQSFNLGFSLDF